ncbi:MAG: succinate dehydrogenase assembly factor 2 [Candidatus Puniceispirillaceae bacterium]
MTETDEMMMRRLIYRASYTGMKETDLLLGQFAKRHLPQLDRAGLMEFEALLDAGDPAIFAWVRGDEDVPAEFDTDVFQLIKQFQVNK